MENSKWIKIGGIVLVIIVSFLLGWCIRGEDSTEQKIIKVTTPEKKGSFESPIEFIPLEPKEYTKIVYEDSIITVPIINQDLVDAHIRLLEENDKLKAAQHYADAVKLNSYENVFDNKDIKLTIKSKTQGTLLELQPEYIIKSQDLTVPVNIPKPKERVFSINLGAGLNTTTKLDKLEPTVNIDLVNKKGHIISGAYGLDGTISLSYKINVFNIKK